MDKIWHRGVIKYLPSPPPPAPRGLAPKDIHADMFAKLGDTALRMQQPKDILEWARRVSEIITVVDDPQQ